MTLGYPPNVTHKLKKVEQNPLQKTDCSHSVNSMRGDNRKTLRVGKINDIQILEAYYGSCNINAIDFTEQVRNKVDNAQTTVSILVDPSTFNISDPDIGTTKSLTIVFSYGTASDLVLSKSGVDGTTLNLNLSANQFEITSAATYGTNLTFIDIKDKLTSFTIESLKNTQLAIGSGEFVNRFCGGADIAPNVQKTLTVSFTVCKQKVNVCANDGQIFDFLKDY